MGLRDPFMHGPSRLLWTYFLLLMVVGCGRVASDRYIAQPTGVGSTATNAESSSPAARAEPQPQTEPTPAVSTSTFSGRLAGVAERLLHHVHIHPIAHEVDG